VEVYLHSPIRLHGIGYVFMAWFLVTHRGFGVWRLQALAALPPVFVRKVALLAPERSDNNRIPAWNRTSAIQPVTYLTELLE
jgi:hypothetical protein